MIHEGICTYEVAKLAKEKGFDWGCLYHYDRKGSLHQHYTYDAMNSGVGVDALLMYNGHLYTSECLAPTQSLLQRWLREEKGIIIELKYSDDTECFRPFWSWQIYNTLGITLEIGEPNTTYELALEDALKWVLENLV